MALLTTIRPGIAAIIFLLIGASTIHAADQPAPAKKQEAPPAATAAPTAPVQSISPVVQSADTNEVALLKQEVALLKEQGEVIRGFQSDMLQTVLWSLGGVVTLALILIGYQTFREKQALLRELKSETQTEIANIEQRQRAALLDERSGRDTAIETLRSELRERIEQAVGDSKESTMAEFRKGLDKLKVQITTNLDLDLKRADFTDLRITVLRREIAEADKNFSMVVTYALQQLEASVVGGHDFYVSSALEALGRAIDNSGEFTISELERAPEILKRVPTSNAKLRDEVAVKLANAKTMK